jgi:hypothetical protein
MPTSTSDLTTVADVREYLQIPTAQTDQNTLIQTFITQCSVTMMRYSGREFAPSQTAVARKFMYRRGGALMLAPYDLRSVTSMVLDSDLTDTTTLTTDDYRLLPVTSPDGTYTSVQIRGYSLPSRSSTLDYDDYREVTITGNWGFSAVPTDVKLAANIMVGWMLRNHSTIPGFGAESLNDRFGPVMWPTAVRQILDHYRIVGFGY